MELFAKNDQLIDQLRQESDRADRIGILLRHSRREAPSGGQRYGQLHLTAEGRQTAIEFGRALPAKRRLRLFCSSYMYCKETAIHIFKGILFHHGSPEFKGSLHCLGPEFMVDSLQLKKNVKRFGAPSVARRWLDTQLSSEVMKDPVDSLRRMMNPLLSLLEEGDGNRIDVFVTHDWNILLVKDLLLGLAHENVGWPDYLDSIVLASHSGKVVLSWKDTHRTIEGGRNTFAQRDLREHGGRTGAPV